MVTDWILVVLLLIVTANYVVERIEDHRDAHRHDWQRVGYAGAGWSLYRCDCGEEDINS